MSLIKDLEWRYATKQMNGESVSEDKIETIKEAIRLAPTSMGLQAYKVFVITDAHLKERIFKEACPQPQIKSCSHLFVFAAYTTITEEQVDTYLETIAREREIPLDTLEAMNSYRIKFATILSMSDELMQEWASRQTYIALGIGLVSAAEQEVDSTPIEGFQVSKLDRVLDLSRRNLSAVTLLALGYRDEENDPLANVKKIRKSQSELFVEM